MTIVIKSFLFDYFCNFYLIQFFYEYEELNKLNKYKYK